MDIVFAHSVCPLPKWVPDLTALKVVTQSSSSVRPMRTQSGCYRGDLKLGGFKAEKSNMER